MNTKQAFFSVQEVAELLGVSVQTIRVNITEGNLKAVRVGGSIRVSRDAIKDFIEPYNE